MGKKRGPQRRLPISEMRRVLVRLPPDLADWVDDTAAMVGVSRDHFLRMQLSGIRDAFAAAGKPGTREADVMARIESRMAEVMREVADGVIERALRATGHQGRKGP